MMQKPIAVGATACYPYSEGWEASLTYVSKYGDEVKLFRRDGNVIYVPRGIADLTNLDPGTDHRSPGEKLQSIAQTLGPRDDDQAQVLEKSLAYLKAGIDHIIEAPTGFGKTFLGVSLGLSLCVPVLIIVTKNDLVGAWKKMLCNPPTHPTEPGFGLPESMIGVAQGQKLDYKGKRFVIGMINSLVMPGKYDSDFWGYFGLGVFDECHRLGADTFQRVCEMLLAKHRLGLSATPVRPDGKDRVINSHIGPILVRGVTVPMVPKVLVKQTGWRIPAGVPYSPQAMATVYGIMGRSLYRNKFILEFVRDSFKAGRTTVIMADGREHLDTLFHLLCQSGCSGADIGFYVSQKTTNKLKAELALDEAKNKRIVLATYAMTKEGTNVPHWDTLILATPKSDPEQAVGRILRSKKGKKQPVVLDLVDGDKLLQNYFVKRMTFYYRLKAEIIRMP